jgi:hypothetical protein
MDCQIYDLPDKCLAPVAKAAVWATAEGHASKIRTDSSFREGCVLHEAFNYGRAQGLFRVPPALGFVP